MDAELTLEVLKEMGHMPRLTSSGGAILFTPELTPDAVELYKPFSLAILEMLQEQIGRLKWRIVTCADMAGEVRSVVREGRGVFSEAIAVFNAMPNGGIALEWLKETYGEAWRRYCYALTMKQRELLAKEQQAEIDARNKALNLERRKLSKGKKK